MINNKNKTPSAEGFMSDNSIFGVAGGQKHALYTVLLLPMAL